MLLTAQIWDAQKLELAGRVGATSRRIASKVVEVLAITHEAPILDRFAQAEHGIRFAPARLGGLWPIVWERDGMKVILRRATEADAKHAASLLTELGYPSTQADVRDRLIRSLRSETSYCLVAESAAEVVGLISAELVFYFPTGSTICRITSLVVSSQHRGHGLGQKLLTAAIDFAREHHCSGLELTSAEGRVDAHRLYRRLGFSRTSFRFFQTV